MNDYMVMPRGANTMVKELNFFNSQGGETGIWGQLWKPVKAKDIEHARVQGAIMPALDGFARVLSPHVRLTHETCDRPGCHVCELYVCKNCGAYEGGLPSDCPQRIITFDESQDVYRGVIDFYEGEWTTKRRSNRMYPQDEYCETCAGLNPDFERDFHSHNFQLWHTSKKDKLIEVRCTWSEGVRLVKATV